METLVLCPEELCLGPIRLTASGIVGLSPVASDFSIWTNTDVEKGTRFLPWKGTVRGDKLPVYDKLNEFDVSNTNVQELAMLLLSHIISKIDHSFVNQVYCLKS